MRPLVFTDQIVLRTGADLRAAIEGAAALEGASASDWLRRTLAAVTASAAAPKPANPHAHVRTEDVPAVWPEIAGWIEAACSRPGCDETADSLRLLCERGDAGVLLLMADDGRPGAAGVIQVRDYQSGKRSCWVLAMGGRPVIPWPVWIAHIEARARGADCSAIEFIGRPGWQRILPDYASECCEAGIHFSKTLGH